MSEQHSPAYLGHCDNPSALCGCEHRQDDHFRGEHACLHSTPEETWSCSCNEFREGKAFRTEAFRETDRRNGS
jgi:hypothetical protein